MQIKLTAAEFAASAIFTSKAIVGLVESKDLTERGVHLLTLTPTEYLAMYPDENCQVLEDGNVLWTMPEEEVLAVLNIANRHSGSIVAVLKMFKTIVAATRDLFVDLKKDLGGLISRKEAIIHKNNTEMMTELGLAMASVGIAKHIVYVDYKQAEFVIERQYFEQMTDSPAFTAFGFKTLEQNRSLINPANVHVTVIVSRRPQ